MEVRDEQVIGGEVKSRTALIAATMTSIPEVVKALVLEHNADLDALELPSKETALSLAADGGNLEILDFLLEQYQKRGRLQEVLLRPCSAICDKGVILPLIYRCISRDICKRLVAVDMVDLLVRKFGVDPMVAHDVGIRGWDPCYPLNFRHSKPHQIIELQSHKPQAPTTSIAR